MLEKTILTSHTSNQQQYRAHEYKKYSDLISCLFVAEKNNELLKKNHRHNQLVQNHLLKRIIPLKCILFYIAAVIIEDMVTVMDVAVDIVTIIIDLVLVIAEIIIAGRMIRKKIYPRQDLRKHL